MTTQIDFYFIDGCGRCPLGGTPNCKVVAWQAELTALRSLVLACGLTEEMKWGVPCYTLQGKNVLLLHAFKSYCALLFINGALLRDTHNLLIQQTEQVQAGRQIRFTNLQAIIEQEETLKSYILQAIAVQKAGLKVALKTTADYEIPIEFEQKCAETPELKIAFAALTPGRQRAYLLHFAAPKQSKTRETRIEAARTHIMQGKGLNDDYTQKK